MTDSTTPEWYDLAEPESVPSPSLLVYHDRVLENINSAIALAGGPQRLRPHVKTHKSASVVEEHLRRKVTRFKCTTIREAGMLAAAGASDILLAYQPVGPNMDRLFGLAREFSGIRISCLVDCLPIINVLEILGERYGIRLPVFVDLDVGMHRTGIAPGPNADTIYASVATSRWLEPAGIHAYDGHARDADRGKRDATARLARDQALGMKATAERQGHEVPEVVLGGTPSFPCHADSLSSGDVSSDAITLSPGTYSYFDWGYASRFPDLPFKPAALVFGRVISVTAPGTFTIDVGSKAIGSDAVQPRGTLLNLPSAVAGTQSEEHWVWSIDASHTPPVGTAVYVWPRHICTSVEHYDEIVEVSDSRMVVGCREVTARGRSSVMRHPTPAATRTGGPT